jgi:hypothetical protein
VADFFGPAGIAALQEIFHGFYRTDVAIYARTSTSNDYSDDQDVYADKPVMTIGWLRNQPDNILTDALSAVQAAQEARLFIPIDVEVNRGDKLTIEGEDWRVIDHNRENTYKVTQRVALERLG